MVKSICEVLDIVKKGTKEEIVTRLLDFLMKPSDSGRKLPKPKRKRKLIIVFSYGNLFI